MRLFKFEIKQQLKSILFWVVTILSLYIAIGKSLPLFNLPVSSNEKAFEFISSANMLGDNNAYHVKLSDITKKYNNKLIERSDCQITNKEGVEDYTKFLKIMKLHDNEVTLRKEINQQFRNALDGFRVSQVFFKILAMYFQEHVTIILIILFSNIWFKNISSKQKDMIYTKPIRQHKYLLSKFMACFTPYILMLFTAFIILGILGKTKIQHLSFAFKLSDAFLPFIIFTMPSLLCAAMFYATVSLILKNPFFAGPLYIALGMGLNFPVFRFGLDAITGRIYDWVSIPPIKLYSGIDDAIVQLITSILLFVLACYIWNDSQKPFKKAYKERR